MEDVLNNLISPKWWLTIVVGTILLDLLKDFAKSKIVKYYKHRYHKYQETVEKKNTEDQATIKLLKMDFRRYVAYSFIVFFEHFFAAFAAVGIIILSLMVFTVSNAAEGSVDNNVSNKIIFFNDLVTGPTLKKIFRIGSAVIMLVSLSIAMVLIWSFLFRNRKRPIFFVVSRYYIYRSFQRRN